MEDTRTKEELLAEQKNQIEELQHMLAEEKISTLKKEALISELKQQLAKLRESGYRRRHTLHR